MRSIKELKDIKGKRALVRVDFNVPIKNGRVEDDFRIKKSLPTIEYLRSQGARITLLTHLGKDGSQSLDPVIERFFEVSKIPQGEVIFYDNVRKFPEEESNDPDFAATLATHGDFFVNEAFSVSHRVHASIVGIPKLLPSYAGFQLEEEVNNLSQAIKNPPHPFLFILGGAKFSTKIPLIKKYLELADQIFIGGALSNDALKARGYEVGRSLVDEAEDEIKNVIDNEKLIVPVDVMVQVGDRLVNRKVDEIKKEETILDVGEETLKKLEPYIQGAKLILWNGPLGKYEVGGEKGTKKILKMVADSQAKSIIGGGDTVAIISAMNLEKDFTFVSTGGGATLEFLSRGTLPGIQALD
jgi:phosphoglycerate kinase